MKNHEKSFKYFDDIINYLYTLSHPEIIDYLFKI
jgi:hypothetical protein